jgi:hypothetical protein
MFIYHGKLNYSTYAVNEGITFIFPSELELGGPVFTSWQWTMNDDKEKDNVWYPGVINQIGFAMNKKKIRFNDSSPYFFDATFTLPMTESTNLPLFSFGVGDSDSNATITGVHLVYKPGLSIPPYPTDPRIYMGKLTTNYAPYATHELLVVVVPGSMDEGSDICAFWQWTNDKSNVDVVTKMSDVQTIVDVGESFHFYYEGSDKKYTFDVEVKEMLDQITLSIKDPDGHSSGDLTLPLQDLDPPAIRKRRAFFYNATTEVHNDSTELVFCTLKNSGTRTTDEILTVFSLLLGSVSMAVATPALGLAAATSATVGKWLAAIGLAVSVGGTVHTYNSTGNEMAMAMFPGDTMKRTSSGSFAWSNNDLHIEIVRVQPTITPLINLSGLRLVASTRTVENIGNDSIQLKNHLPGRASDPLYTERLSIELPSKMRLMACRLISVANFTTFARPGQSARNVKVSDIPNALTTTIKSTVDSTWHGTLDAYYKTVESEKDVMKMGKMFEFKTGVYFTITQGVDEPGGSHASVVTVGSGPALLKLKNCRIDGKGFRMRALRGCRNEDEVKAQIEANGGNKAYGWSSRRDRWLYAYSEFGQGTVIVASDSADDCVYFVVASCRPILSLVNDSE